MATESHIMLVFENTLDAKLIALGRDLEAAIEHERECKSKLRAKGEENYEAFQAANDEVLEIIARIRRQKARTTEGRKVKARALERAFMTEFDSPYGGYHLSLLRSLIDDLLAA